MWGSRSSASRRTPRAVRPAMARGFRRRGRNVDPITIPCVLRWAISRAGVRTARRSLAAYRNTAVGFEGDDFVNLVGAFETANDASGLVREQLQTSRNTLCGRPPMRRSGGRARWISTFCLSGSSSATLPGLQLPRPDLVRARTCFGRWPTSRRSSSIRRCTRRCGSCGKPSWARFTRCRSSPSHAPTAVDRQNLAGDERRVLRQKERSANDVVR